MNVEFIPHKFIESSIWLWYLIPLVLEDQFNADDIIPVDDIEEDDFILKRKQYEIDDANLDGLPIIYLAQEDVQEDNKGGEESA